MSIRRQLKIIATGIFLALPWIGAASAQNNYCYIEGTAPPKWTPCQNSNPLAVSASVSASITPFLPSTSGSRGTPLSVTTSDSSGNLPTGDAVVVTNVGSNPMYCNVAGVAATTSDQLITASGGWFVFTPIATVTTLHCIATGSSTTANSVGGSGLPAGTGGGSGSGGGAVTLASGAVSSGAYSSGSIASGAFASGSIGSGAIASGAVASGAYASGAFASGSGADGWDVSTGATSAAAATAGSTGSVNAKLRLMTSQLDTIATNVASAVPAGTNIIGKVGIDQTTPGTTNGVQVNAALPAGTNRVGYTSDDPCTQKAKTNLPISQNGTSSVQLIALSGATVIYVCSLSLIAAGATTVAITTGTGSACVTGNAAVIGSTTSNIANSMSFAANGGLTLGSGHGTIAQGAASSELCMILGSNVFVSGNLTYVQQ